ncbi:MAG: aromatic ring-hydroxylating dioxygenase subunit alpha [Sphingomonadales bacterium]|nr:aromatic ring-hydroxylating dioxygenase subunit alpha [Sphingomonadales bacterium]
MTASYEPVPDDAFAWLGHDPIPAAAYTDPAHYALECEAVFKRAWVLAGHECEFPEAGSFVVRDFAFARASIIIVRGKDGVLRAFHNVCTHRGTRLVDAAAGKGQTFSCPYHMWTFGTDGRLLSAPDFERFYIDKADCSLKPVHVESCGGLVFVNFARAPKQGLAEFLGPFAEQLGTTALARATTFAEYFYEVDANWKLYMDNFQENYHLRFIHPNTGAAAIGQDNPLGYPTGYAFFGPHRQQTLWKNPDMAMPPPLQARAMGLAARHAAVEDAGTPRGKVDMKLFPNLFVIGQSSYVFTHCVQPLSHDRTRGWIRMYWIGEDTSASQCFAREYVLGMIRDVHAEDRGVIQRGQIGLQSGALEHIHFQTHEVLCRHLNVQLADWIADYRAGG